MRGLLSLLVVVAILASGCTRERDNPYDPDVAADLGAARIIVQDNHQDRVVNATILLASTAGAERGYAGGSTDDKGIFMAEDLEPGAYEVTVNKDGFSDRKDTFLVSAGLVTEHVVHVDRLR